MITLFRFMVVDALAHTRSPNMDGMKTYFVIGKHDNTQPKVGSISALSLQCEFLTHHYSKS